MPHFSLPHHLHPTLTRLTHVTLLALGLAASLFFHTTAQAQIGTPLIDCPNEKEITVPNAEVRLMTNPAVRDTNKCLRPTVVFLHATNGSGLDGIWGWFNSGSQGNNVNAHFIVGTNGTIIQTTKLYSAAVEFARTNDPYNNYSIAIEMEHPDMEYANKAAVSDKQWQATLNLVAFLMQQYNIPMGLEYDHLSPYCFDDVDPEIIKGGVYSHYQIGPDGSCPKHTDIGQTTFKEFREDLAKLTGLTGGSASTLPGGIGGRMVPYDKYARPYSWPMSGTVKQNYGFTEEAQSLGQRFPGLYPYGDPNVIFSTTNHTEPPLDPTKSRYLNPNIDIQPSNSQASSRAVYATHAGWLTYAGWAGPNKGYTIQIESDVEGDGQSDLATRYMRLAPPVDGQFAPDINEYYPPTTAIPNPTLDNPTPLDVKVPPMNTIEAEDMTIQNTSNNQTKIVSDDQASRGQAVHFTDAAQINLDNIPYKADKLIITAKASKSPLCLDSFASLIVRTTIEDLDPVAIPISAGSPFYRKIEVPVSGLDGRQHAISIAFTNPNTTVFQQNTSLGLCHRQLWIDSLSYVVTDPTQPTVETVSEVDVEAESLDKVIDDTYTKPADTIQDNLASGDHYVAFTSNSKIESKVQLPQSNYISMRARADICGDQFPLLTVKIDDQTVWQNSVRYTDWQFYSGELQLGGATATETSTTLTNPEDEIVDLTGDPPAPQSDTNSDTDTTTEHLLAIEFNNDHNEPLNCDRNVYLDFLTFTNYQVAQATPSQTSLIGKTKYVARDQLIGYVSASRGNEQEWQAFQTEHHITEPEEGAQDRFRAAIPNANQTYLSYRIMYNNPNLTTFPAPNMPDSFINAKVDNPYITESSDNTVAGNLKTIFDRPQDDMFFFCAPRLTGNTVRCINLPNP